MSGASASVCFFSPHLSFTTAIILRPAPLDARFRLCPAHLYNGPEMRPVLAAQLCLSVFSAFLLAPAQHVHEGGEEHDHSTLVHAHFSAHHVQPVRPGEQAISEAEEHEAWSLDTFTIVPPAGLPAFLLSRAPDPLFAMRTGIEVVTRVEERTHDPPLHTLSTPRAPPV